MTAKTASGERGRGGKKKKKRRKGAAAGKNNRACVAATCVPRVALSTFRINKIEQRSAAHRLTFGRAGLWQDREEIHNMKQNIAAVSWRVGDTTTCRAVTTAACSHHRHVSPPLPCPCLHRRQQLVPSFCVPLCLSDLLLSYLRRQGCDEDGTLGISASSQRRGSQRGVGVLAAGGDTPHTHGGTHGAAHRTHASAPLPLCHCISLGVCLPAVVQLAVTAARHYLLP